MSPTVGRVCSDNLVTNVHMTALGEGDGWEKGSKSRLLGRLGQSSHANPVGGRSLPQKTPIPALSLQACRSTRNGRTELAIDVGQCLQLVMSVQPARVGEHPDDRWTEGLRLAAESGFRQSERPPVRGHAEECDGRGLVAPDESR